jgi:3'-5' exoribonuclease
MVAQKGSVVKKLIDKMRMEGIRRVITNTFHTEKKMQIKDLQTGMILESYHVLIETRTQNLTKAGKAYLKLSIRDTGGSLNCNLWDYDDLIHSFIKEGDTACITAVIETYNGSLQGNIKAIVPSNKSPMDFAKRTRFDVEKLWSELVDTVGKIEEPMTKFVAEELLLKHSDIIDGFKKAPAARGLHNAWYGGLLEHVWSMLRLAYPVVQHYQKHYCDKISLDKVLFGVLVHDMGKILEYDYSKPSFSFTMIGILTNHIVLGPAWIYEASNRWLKEVAKNEDLAHFKKERAHLMHLVASHHNTNEWGSPVQPASIEAIILHHIDNIDSKVMHALELVEGKPGPVPGMSERSYIERKEYMRY